MSDIASFSMEVEMRSMLRQHRVLMPTTITKGTEVSKLINTIIDIRGSINCYLEIGVEYGMTLESVKAKNKIGIDPNFRFHKGFQTFNLSLHQMNSDQYFSLGTPEVIDIAFIDGLHTATQTYKDFINLLPRVDEKSIIIIDDSVPSDIHSALITPEAAYDSRSKAGVTNDFKWHGDVYRCVYSLIDNFPELSCVTIADIGNPVTIFYDFGKINRYVKNQNITMKNSYDDFLSNAYIRIPNEFNPISKNEFYSKLQGFYESL